MALSEEIDLQVKEFLSQSKFSSKGCVVTDLDGTAVHEDRGKVYIPEPVELGLKQLHTSGRPFVLNSLRFPLSVLQTFGQEWYAISNSPIPTVSLNGSLIGLVTRSQNEELAFEEIDAFPLTPSEIEEVLEGVRRLLDGGMKDILVFYYPRDWRIGEVIWNPAPDNILYVKKKYNSASSVTSVEFEKLRNQLLAEDICMIFLLIDLPEDQLMAYQHTKRSNFFTHEGVDKLFGSEKIAAALKLDLQASIGAGDTEMDRFLNGVGMAVIVGNQDLDFRGLRHTIRLRNSFEFGELLFRVAELQRI